MTRSQDDIPVACDPELPATPRWVKIFGVVGLVLLVLFVLAHLAGYGLGGHMHGHLGEPVQSDRQ
ncbi:MAG: hypothetical protein ABI895_16560 [Deltaproteobacteria bacterium]